MRPGWKATRVSLFAGVAVAAVPWSRSASWPVNVLPRQPDGPTVGARSRRLLRRRPYLPAMTTTFVSPIYGYSFKYHDRGGRSHQPTELCAALGATSRSTTGNFDDRFDAVETGSRRVLRGRVDRVCRMGSTHRRMGRRVRDAFGGWRSAVCLAASRQRPSSRQPGRSECARFGSRRPASSPVGRLYLFTLSTDRSDARAVFDGFAATIALDAGDSVRCLRHRPRQTIGSHRTRVRPRSSWHGAVLFE